MDSACHHGRDDDHPRRADRRGQHLHFRSWLDGDHRGQRHGSFQEKDGRVRLYVRHYERGGAARQPLGDDDRFRLRYSVCRFRRAAAGAAGGLRTVYDHLPRLGQQTQVQGGNPRAASGSAEDERVAHRDPAGGAHRAVPRFELSGTFHPGARPAADVHHLRDCGRAVQPEEDGLQGLPEDHQRHLRADFPTDCDRAERRHAAKRDVRDGREGSDRHHVYHHAGLPDLRDRAVRRPGASGCAQLRQRRRLWRAADLHVQLDGL